MHRNCNACDLIYLYLKLSFFSNLNKSKHDLTLSDRALNCMCVCVCISVGDGRHSPLRTRCTFLSDMCILRCVALYRSTRCYECYTQISSVSILSGRHARAQPIKTTVKRVQQVVGRSNVIVSFVCRRLNIPCTSRREEGVTLRNIEKKLAVSLSASKSIFTNNGRKRLMKKERD